MERCFEKKGYTLAELLIVVAIIGVLVAVSIPIFTNQLKKARLATNQANARAAYSAAMAWYIENSDTNVQEYKDAGIYDVATGQFHPGIDISDRTLAKFNNSIADWKSSDPAGHTYDTHKAGDMVYKKFVIYWNDPFDGTIYSFEAL
ncbi:type IV pilin protein [Oribacterium sp. WCC10]|uniref:type IV pilin protein n=1 Tax=Oribacterium sp. WCC10 TaxID=1855343 RepID=UPI0008E17CA7|nr:prepilin-type N-terminal cleavage/methylation domain-containing protein [Oribacterium sp. WCC10]SFG18769.1 prepilin-type N-terminal cleavage/methylation domain-containing protein [Oribacterium sp. WCC10]